MTAKTSGQGEEPKETLFGHQMDVREAAEKLYELLVFSETKKEEIDRPHLPNVEEMAEYECETWKILQDAIAQARRLGYDG